jgi:predicted GTPase
MISQTRSGPSVRTADASPAILDELASLAESYSAFSMATFVRTARDRLSEGRFFLACVGQFKRGKSTLINALTGHEILPVGVAPVTTVATVMRFGTELRARILDSSQSWTEARIDELAEFVSEDRNPENKKGVMGVEVFAPAALLANGMNLVDTPGIGSVFAGNTTATFDFLPHVDAALVVLGADPPISGEERALVATIAGQVSRLVFVLNKADRVSAADADAAAAFTKRVLAETLGHAAFDLFRVSALERLETGAATRDWAALESELRDGVAKSGRAIIAEANRRIAGKAAARIAEVIENEKRMLTEPLADSEVRMSELRGALRGAEDLLGDLAALLAAEQSRVTVGFAARREEFLRGARRYCTKEFRAQATERRAGFNGPNFRRRLNRMAQRISRDELAPFLEREAAHAEQVFAETTKRFAEIATSALVRIARTGVPGLEALSADELAMPTLATSAGFRFYSIERVAAPASPIRYIADLALGVIGVRSAAIEDAERFLELLLYTNSARVQNGLTRRMEEARQALERAIRSRLVEAATVGERSLARAREAQGHGATAVREALAKLESDAEMVRALGQRESSASRAFEIP